MILIFKWNRRTQKITIRSKNRPPRKKVPFLYYKLNFKIPSKGNLGKSVRIDQGLWITLLRLKIRGKKKIFSKKLQILNDRHDKNWKPKNCVKNENIHAGKRNLGLARLKKEWKERKKRSKPRSWREINSMEIVKSLVL
jgi:hypothetical protein